MLVNAVASADRICVRQLHWTPAEPRVKIRFVLSIYCASTTFGVVLFSPSFVCLFAIRITQEVTSGFSGNLGNRQSWLNSGRLVLMLMVGAVVMISAIAGG